jgi:TonB-dependent receptor
MRSRTCAARAIIAFSAGASALALAAPASAQDGRQSDNASVPPSDKASKSTSSTAAQQGTQSATSSDVEKPDSNEVIVVTGYAASLRRAIAHKRNLDVISDGISAEDIGKFPEQNIAESLQRVTGVQITRDLGEGQFLSVRGLDPKFTDTLYNGRQLPSGSGTRAFDFQVLTANFASQIDVYKSPSADMPESGLAATVNIQSTDPLSIKQRRFAVTAEGVYDQQARGIRPHVSALYMDKFFDDRLGWSVSVDVNQRNLNDQQFVTDGVLPDFTYPGPGTHYRVFGIHQNDLLGTDKRISAASALQFQATDNLQLRFDTILSRFKQNYNYFQGNNWYPGAGALGPSPTDSETVDENGVETAWSGTNVFAWTQANRFGYVQNLWSSALGAKLDIGPWNVNAELSYGKATERQSQIYVSWATAGPGASLSYDTTADPGGPLSFGFYNGFDPTDVSHYYFFGVQGTYRWPTTDKIRNGRLDVARDLGIGFFRKLRFGANLQDRTLAKTPNAIPATSAGFASDMSQYLTIHDNPAFFSSYNGPADFPRTFLTVDLDKFFHDYPLSEFVASNPPKQVLTTTTEVEERTAAGYVRLDFAGAADRLRGNVGLRYVYTQEASSGYVPTPGSDLVYGFFGSNTLSYSDAALQAQKHSYTNLLPSLNVSYELSNDLIVRFAAARVMQRPDMNLLAAASSPNASSGPPPVGTPWRGTLSLGNPALKPYLANQFDLSIERYIGHRGLAAVAIFAKDVKNLVLTSYYDLPATVKLGTGELRPITLSVAQPVNAESTMVKGIEAGIQQPLEFLPGPLRWLGVEANYTHIWSGKVVLNQGQPALPLTGISKNTYNLSAYYDDGRLSVHAGYNYRGPWVEDPLSFFGDGIFVKGYGQLDVSASYKINPNFSLTASASNLTSSALRQVDRYGVTRLYDLSGRRFVAGVRATF